MNIQLMLKQAQKLQQDMTKEKAEIDKTIFKASSAFVDVELLGTKKIVKIKIKKDKLDQDDIEMVEDMLLTSINSAIQSIDSVTEQKLGKFTNGMPGLL